MGPITTVHNEHFCGELAAVARVGLVTRSWLSDKNSSAAVVLGNHPISVGQKKHLETMMRGWCLILLTSTRYYRLKSVFTYFPEVKCAPMQCQLLKPLMDASQEVPCARCSY